MSSDFQSVYNSGQKRVPYLLLFYVCLEAITPEL